MTATARATKRTPAVPKHLSLEANKWWATILETYSLDASDLLMLEGLLESFDRMRQAQECIAKHGLVCQPAYGGMARVNPAVKIEADCKKLIIAHAKLLGLDLEIE